VHFIEAELVPAPKSEPAPTPPGAEKPTEGGPAPAKPAEPAPSAPPPEPAPSAPPATGNAERGRRKTGGPTDDSKAEPAAPAKDAPPDEAKEPPKPWDSREWTYRLKMAVRVQLDSIEFSEPPPRAAHPGPLLPKRRPAPPAPVEVAPQKAPAPQTPPAPDSSGTPNGP